MLELRALALSAIAALSLGASSAQAATFLDARTTSACSDSCFSAKKTVFTQTFSASQFGGGDDVIGLALQRSVLGSMQDTIFKVSFETADGTKLGSWGSFQIAGLGGDTVYLGGDMVRWTGGQDLVLKLELVLPDTGGGGGGGFGGGGFFGGGGGGGFGGGGLSPFGGGALSRTDAIGDQLIVPVPAMPAAALLQPTAIAVPEPGAWALMLLGMGALGATLRSKRALARRFG